MLLKECSKRGKSFDEVLSLKDNEDNTPLHSAVSGGNKDAIQICLEFVSFK